MSKHPYKFPLRSRAAMTKYILDRTNYHDHYHPFPFSWNVKVYDVDWRHPKGETIDAALDDEWERHAQENEWVSQTAFEDAARTYCEKEYATYPGLDQGDWEFGFYGRSGGHLCLETWRGSKLNGYNFDVTEWVRELSMQDLRTFYRALVCMDHDFTPAKASENVEYCLNFLRVRWEEEKRDEIEQANVAMAEATAEARPDLAPQYQ